MTDILDLLEPGDYPAEANLLEMAAISQAVSTKRIADLMATGGSVATSHTPAAPGKRTIGGGNRAPAAAAPATPAAPVLPPGYVAWDGKSTTPPVDRMAEVLVFWRNGKIMGPGQNGAPNMTAQQFVWKWGNREAPSDILGYYVAPLDQAHRMPTPAGAIPTPAAQPLSPEMQALVDAAEAQTEYPDDP